MPTFNVRIIITKPPGLLDPEAEAITKCLQGGIFNFPVKQTSVGKLYELKLTTESEEEAQKQAEAMCQKLFINHALKERHTITITPIEA